MINFAFIMQRPLHKHITTFLFLVTFLLPRIVDIHALNHLFGDDETISCELCDIASNSQQFDLFIDVVSYDDGYLLNTISSIVIDAHYNTPLDKIVSPTSVYNKPPPYVIFG